MKLILMSALLIRACTATAQTGSTLSRARAMMTSLEPLATRKSTSAPRIRVQMVVCVSTSLTDSLVIATVPVSTVSHVQLTSMNAP